MSKILEYIKLLPKAIVNIDKIADSFINQVKMEFGTLPQEELEIIAGRRLICSQCPFNSLNAIAGGYYITDRTDVHCIHCECNIQAKTASLISNCGIEAFNLNNKDKPLPLKWHKVK